MIVLVIIRKNIFDGNLIAFIRIFTVGRLLKVVHQFEELITCGRKHLFFAVGQAKQDQLAFFHFAFHIRIMNTVQFDLTFEPFELVPVIMIGKIDGYADLNELVRVVLILVQFGFQPIAGLVLHQVGQ